MFSLGFDIYQIARDIKSSKDAPRKSEEAIATILAGLILDWEVLEKTERKKFSAINEVLPGYEKALSDALPQLFVKLSDETIQGVQKLRTLMMRKIEKIRGLGDFEILAIIADMKEVVDEALKLHTDISKRLGESKTIF